MPRPSFTQAMLFDTLEIWILDKCWHQAGRRVLVFAPADAGPWFDARLARFSSPSNPMTSSDPRGTLHAFFAGEIGEGASRVVVIGSDAPTLDPTIIVSAFLCLESRDIVIGPATDGGLYLVGARGPVPSFLDSIRLEKPACPGPIDRSPRRHRAIAIALAAVVPGDPTRRNADARGTRSRASAGPD